MTRHSNNDDNDVYDSTAAGARGVGHIIRLLVIAAMIAALVLVALDNTDDVRIGYVFGEAMAPIWIVLIGAALAGIIIGWLVVHRPRRSRRD
ncbi:MAG: LapA family protein [Ilumatobacteraceae bacterium]